MPNFVPLLSKTVKSSPIGPNIKPFELIPGPKPLPFIGNIWRYLPLIGQYKPDTLVENAIYNRKTYGPIVREEITNNLTVLHLFRPEDIEALFRQDGKYPHRRSHRALLKYRHDRPTIYRDGGLFPENGHSWHRQRMQFQTRLLSKSQVSANIGKLDQVALKTIDRIDLRFEENSNSLFISDFETILYDWALGNSLALFLDLDIYQLDRQLVDRTISELHNSLASTDKTEIQTNKWIKSPDKCPFYKILAKSQDFLYDFVSETVARASASPPSKFSYLDHWIRVDKLDTRDITSFIIDLLMAGMHTTSYATAFLLRNITNNEGIAHTLKDEVDKCMPQTGHITGRQIDHMTLLRNCLKETLRLDPVSIGTGRLVNQENTIIDSYEIPKGTQIITQNQVISRDPSIYDQPDMFDPNRWARYRNLPKDQRPSPFATLPFGFGTRACLGQRLSELQIKIFVARLVQKYKLQIDAPIPTKTTLIHNLNGNIGLQLTSI